MWNWNPIVEPEPPEEEVKRANGATWIHLGQIENAKGDLVVYENEYGVKRPFEFLTWPGDGKDPIECKSDATKVGGGFESGEGVGIWFAYPLELTFYLLPPEDVAVIDIDYGELEPSSQGEATVIVYRSPGRNAAADADDDDADDPDFEVTTSLVFSIGGSEIGRKSVTLQRGQELEVDFSFLVPEKGVIVMKAEINPEPRDFEEATYGNNTLIVSAVIGKYQDIPYWVYSRDILFNLPPAVAPLYLPRGRWTGTANGTLYVHNVTPPRNIYHDFAADGIAAVGNTVTIPIINDEGEPVSRWLLISATLNREEFGDNPLASSYASNDADPLPRFGHIRTSGSVSRPYEWIDYCGGCCSCDDGGHCGGHVIPETAHANFGDVAFHPDNYDAANYYANVYNGMTKQELSDRYTKTFNKYASKSSTNYKFDLAWEGTHYDFDVIRWMCHLNVENEEIDWTKVAGQYKRTFIGQSSGSITWNIKESQSEFYEGDRERARGRLTGSGNYKHAVFATDRQLQNYEWPIKSGYYFNPGGTYTCTVYTEQYKDSPDDTAEHKELVEAVKNAFMYESQLVYVDRNQTPSQLGPITRNQNRGLLEISQGDFINITLDRDESPLETTHARDDAEEIRYTVIDKLFQEVMEGYKDSNTADSNSEYRYREYTKKGIWLVKEKTVIEFTISVPSGRTYTHVNMKNGEYGIRTQINEIKFKFDNNHELTMSQFTLDNIKVTVSGSMYDDR